MTATQPPAVIDRWEADSYADGALLVLPDGCRDLIASITPGRRPRWWVSHLFDAAEPYHFTRGSRLVGYRLHPAAVIDVAGLQCHLGARTDIDPHDLPAAIHAHVAVDPRIADALAGLAGARTVGGAARRLGVSERTLERQTVTGTGRRPVFWKGLSRARRAAASLTTGVSLAEAAADHGYADQAHMTREFQRWFTVSPRQFRQRPDLVAQVTTPGYR